MQIQTKKLPNICLAFSFLRFYLGTSVRTTYVLFSSHGVNTKKLEMSSGNGNNGDEKTGVKTEQDEIETKVLFLTIFLCVFVNLHMRHFVKKLSVKYSVPERREFRSHSPSDF